MTARGRDADVFRCTAASVNSAKAPDTRRKSSRLVAIFAFFDRPGVVMTAKDQTGFYGRATTAA